MLPQKADHVENQFGKRSVSLSQKGGLHIVIWGETEKIGTNMVLAISGELNWGVEQENRQRGGERIYQKKKTRGTTF